MIGQVGEAEAESVGGDDESVATKQREKRVVHGARQRRHMQEHQGDSRARLSREADVDLPGASANQVAANRRAACAWGAERIAHPRNSCIAVAVAPIRLAPGSHVTRTSGRAARTASA